MKRRDHTEIVAIAIPLLIEVIAVTFTIGVAILWAAIATGRL